MKNVSILVPETAVLQAIADPQYLFSAVNQFMTASGRQPLFNVQLVGLKKTITLNNGLYTVNTTQLLEDVGKTDLIVIPALFGDMKTAVEANEKVVPWIKEQYANGAEVASLCVGAFLLAATGLLDGKKCSTHWGFQNEFREMYPDVEVVDGSILTEESRIYSSGGANSYWNLLLHLVEKYTDRATAILASKYFAVDIDRESQSAFAMFQGQKNHNDEAVKQAQLFIEANTQEKITIEELANLVALGRRSFERRFKKATNNSVLEYINRVKIEFAKRSFETNRRNVTEVMYDIGYTDTKGFRTIFKKITGLTPIEYRNKYNKGISVS
ncbi:MULTISPECIES: helix-turn-helix domain-containing protein [unclassified Flavobacterium]|uniref:GlxA family transcriptional regulator n=1 Tax=unclassified Flavobacterium TaxID=196869 RepID=UPI00086AF87F|nr:MULTISPECIES: helix-turn-helix domain-containing protein [unclassified Flavobacterium]MBN9283740.1 helix-turn-helix domain-containing protein [Flavobacterium sp.]ODS91165.1 MAG: AraC family transcriptional regulator [Chryseobacterium sp. SCN 40-13]OJV68754.1 MAG: AraC family transcriptional regulator [Flavobacterium sp. 40-81]